MAAGGAAGTKAAPDLWSAARTADAVSAHAAASAIAPPAIGPTRARRSLVEKLHDGNKMSSRSVIPAQLALPLVENDGARSRFRTEVGQNLYAMAFRTIVSARTTVLKPSVRSAVAAERGEATVAEFFWRGAGTREISSR
jgi:hypothetical protein